MKHARASRAVTRGVNASREMLLAHLPYQPEALQRLHDPATLPSGHVFAVPMYYGGRTAETSRA